MKSILSAVVGATLALSAIEADAAATPGERQVSLTIETDTLASALDKWAQQSGFQIFVQDWEAAKNLPARSLKGTFTAQDALEQLLSGTPLTYVWISDKAVSIRKKVAQTVPTALQRTSLEGQQAIPVAKFSGDDRSGASTAHLAAVPGTGDSGNATSRLAQIEEVIVTGTNIRGSPPSSSPVTVYNREAIDRTGAATVEAFVRTIPQNFASIGADTLASSGSSNNIEGLTNSTFGSAVNLHGLGAGSTLTLVNGHRLAPSGTDGLLTDVSLIPMNAIERIEVLTDGASAIYGADAVGGVINFILRKDFDGALSTVRYGDTSRGGGTETTLSQLLGTSWETGNVLLTYEHDRQEPVLASERTFVPDQGGLFQILPEQQRDSAYVNARQEITSTVSVFADGSYSEREFTRDVNTFFADHTSGFVRQYGGTVGVAVDLPADWRTELTPSYSRTTQEFDRSFNGTPLPKSGWTGEFRSINLRADGPLFSMGGGAVRASVGGEFRREHFGSESAPGPGVIGSDLERDVSSLFAEVFIPIIGESNPTAFAKTLELSLAARYDDYEEVGSSTSPKIGVSWAPIRSLHFRATYGESFRAPPLAQLSDAGRFYVGFPLPDPQSPSGITNTLAAGAPGNPALGPEKAKSYTVGVDLSIDALPGFYASLTYYNIKYRDRIAGPPLVGPITALFSQRDTLAPFINESPSLAEVQAIFDSGVLLNFFGLTPADIGAIFDGRYQNMVRMGTSGLDFTVGYERATRLGVIGASVGGNYIRELEYQATSTTASADLVSTIYNPSSLRLRGAITWSAAHVSSTLSVNYTDDYQNSIQLPAAKVSSWTTLDWQISAKTGESARSWLLRDLTFSLSVQNLTDRDPPKVVDPVANLGYDSMNASALGRTIAAQVSKGW